MNDIFWSSRRSEWYEWVRVTLMHVTERVASMQGGFFWTLSYVLLLAFMYLFHSPFRSQMGTRTDWYAQVTKGLQIWLAAVLLCFHVGPHLVESPPTAATATAVKVAAFHATQEFFMEDTVATIFLPIFCYSSILCLWLHKKKRRYKLVLTYGSSLALILINSVLLSCFATMHYTACSHVLAGRFATRSTAATNHGTWIGSSPATETAALPPLSARMRLIRVVCPQPVAEKPFACIAFLSTICSVFIMVDYAYKKWHANGDPSRGILWAELFPEKDAHHSSALAVSSRALGIIRYCGLLRFGVTKNATAARLGLSEHDPRLQEMSPRTIRFPSRASRAQHLRGTEQDSQGWQDENDQLSIAAAKHIYYPTNRPGMVPWFSTFIMNTTWQALARMLLEFLTFDVRLLQHYATPKVFALHFSSTLTAPPGMASVVEEPLRCTGDSTKLFSSRECLGELPSSSLAGLRSTQSPRESSPSVSPTSKTGAQKLEGDGDIWFDWIADVGDGFNPTYAMARLLAQPSLKLPWHRRSLARRRFPFRSTFKQANPPSHSPTSYKAPAELPRGSFVVIGGDLAYPSPDDETYTTRLFEPYQDAMSANVRLQNLFHAEQQHVVVADANDADVAHVHLLDAATVSGMATGRAALCSGRATAEEALRSVPLLFAIPGNHDWFDGLATFRKYILERTWIGGWLMPQRSSFFVLRLPHNWFMLCGDTGNVQDIDVAQRNYFLDAIEKYMDAESCVILAAHEPGWVYDSMLHKEKLTQPELAKVAEVLGTRLRLRLAGDIHHYSRHCPRDSTSGAPMLVVSGGGGAFLHGPRSTPIVSQLTAYRRACAFPHRNTLPTLMSRLLGFRVINWKFDLIIGVCCFMVVVSLLPQSIKDARRSESGPLMTLPVAVAAWWERVCLYIVTLYTKGVASVLMTVTFFVVFAAAGAEKNTPIWLRAVHSSLWTFVTVFICCGMLSYLLCTVEYMVDNHLLVSSSGHWGSAVEDQVRAAVDGLLNHTQRRLGGADASFSAYEIRRIQTSLYGGPLVSWCGVLLRCLDPFEMLAYLSDKVSSPELGTFAAEASRLDEVLYYLYFVFFYWILVTPLVSFVIGSYLMCSVTLFDCLYDATYSAFQIEEYKHFVRFRLDAATRELHGYVITMRKVPKVWVWDELYQAELKGDTARAVPPHLRAHPSRWHGKSFRSEARRERGDGGHSHEPDMDEGVEILEHFVCAPHRSSADTPPK